MSQSLVCIAEPTAEPVELGEFKNFLEIPDGDTSRDAKLTSFLLAARVDRERYTRTRFITQTWLLRSDSFPGISLIYDRNGYPALELPMLPFQSVQKFWFVDTAGSVEELLRDTSYGNTAGSYGYQLEHGGGLVPARLVPTWARPWPPSRLVPANTMVEFRCGYGGPLTVSIANGSAALSSGAFKFNPDDAQILTGDKGTAIRIPGAGPLVDGEQSDLVTSVLSVDSNGAATLADAASASVSNIDAWLGAPVPEPLRLAIMFQAQFFFEQGAVVDMPSPRIVDQLSNSYRNLVS